MPPRKKTSTTPKVKAKSTKTLTKSTTPTSKQPAKKPSVRKTATKKPTAKKPTTKTSGKSTTTTPKKRKTTPRLKRKQLSPQEMHPFPTFPYRLEYKDGNDIRVCHFECEEHRDKHIQRYKLRKNQYFIDNLT